jgi:hypothetical protein
MTTAWRGPQSVDDLFASGTVVEFADHGLARWSYLQVDMTKAFGTVRASNALRIVQCFDSSLQLSLTETKIGEDLAVRNASASLSSDVEQNFRGMAWPARLVYRLQKSRQIEAHVRVVCDTSAHQRRSLLTKTMQSRGQHITSEGRDDDIVSI